MTLLHTIFEAGFKDVLCSVIQADIYSTTATPTTETKLSSQTVRNSSKARKPFLTFSYPLLKQYVSPQKEM